MRRPQWGRLNTPKRVVASGNVAAEASGVNSKGTAICCRSNNFRGAGAAPEGAYRDQYALTGFPNGIISLRGGHTVPQRVEQEAPT